MEMNVFVTCSTNWADEMDIIGQSIFTKDAWKEFENKLKERTESIEICIGTNEYLNFSNGQRFLDRCVVQDIPKEHSDIIEQYARLDPFELFYYVLYNEDEEFDDEE